MLLESITMEFTVVVSFFLVMPTILHFLYRQLRKFCNREECQSFQSSQPTASVKESPSCFAFIYSIILGKSDEHYLASTCKLFKQLGSTYSIKSCIWQTVFTSESKNIKHILATSFDDFELPQLRVSAISTLLGTGIFSVNGASWSHARAMLRPCFAKRDKLEITSMLEDHFQSFLRLVPRDGTEVDLQPLYFALTMDFATQFLTSKSSNMLDETKSHAKAWQFFEDYTICSEEVIKKMCLGPLQIFRYNRSASQAKKRVFEYIDEFIGEALPSTDSAAASPEHSVLTKLAGLTSDRKVLRDQMLHLLVASRDTTASLLCNLFFMLTKQPKMYTRLRLEVLSVSGDAPPLPEQLKQMEYLRWCVQESLRLHPVIPTNAREAKRDTTLPVGGGSDGSDSLLVTKGALIVYNVFAMHRDESVFGANAEEFEPERWASLRPGWGYLPFNGGPRICLGQQIALLEAHYLVARMVQTFETMVSQESRDWEELFALATTCKHGVKVKMGWA